MERTLSPIIYYGTINTEVRLSLTSGIICPVRALISFNSSGYYTCAALIPTKRLETSLERSMYCLSFYWVEELGVMALKRTCSLRGLGAQLQSGIFSFSAGWKILIKRTGVMRLRRDRWLWTAGRVPAVTTKYRGIWENGGNGKMLNISQHTQ